MKNNKKEKFNSEEIYWNFLNLFREYIGKDDFRKMFYAKLYLIYLAKRYKFIDLKECKNFSELLKKINDLWFALDITKEYNNINDINELFEKNYTNEELDGEMFNAMSKLTEEEIAEIFRKNSIEYKRYSSIQNDTTSKSIAELVSKILNIENNEEVLDLCSGNGDFLASLTNNEKDMNLNGIEIDKDIAFISKIRLTVLSNKEPNIVVDDALTYDFGKKFDKIFCEYPFGLRVDSYRINKLSNQMFYSWNKPGLTSDWIFLNKIVTLLKNNGMAAILITDGPLLKSMDKDYRKDILESKLVKYIIKLPSGIIPYTNINPNLIILSKGNDRNEITFIDATQEYKENSLKERQLNVDSIMELINDKNNDTDKVKTEKINKICSTDDVVLTVNSYVKKKEPNYINPHILKDYLTDKYRGYQFSSKEQAEIEDINGDYELLTIGDINEGIISSNLLKINGNNNKYDRYLLKTGDVVISSRGTKIKVAVAEVGNRKIIPNGNLLVLRLDTEKIDPYYLEAYLNSENGLLTLKKIQTGAVIISINPSRIEQIKVSMVNKEEQELFVEKYKRKMTELFLAQEHVKKLKDQINNLFTKEIEEKNGNG